jgi:hypothetical protein
MGMVSAYHRKMGELPRTGVQAELVAPGSRGEHDLQRRYGAQERARRFYEQQVLDRLNERMVQFIGCQEMVWIATADGHGECDCSFRAGPPGFVQVLDDRTVRYPEYRGNGSWPPSVTSPRTPTSA